MGPIANNREDGGRLVRDIWINKWAARQPNPKPSWLIPWDEMEEADREADRIIWDELTAPYRTELAQIDILSETLTALVVRYQERQNELTYRASRVQERLVGLGEQHWDLQALIEDLLTTIDEQGKGEK